MGLSSIQRYRHTELSTSSPGQILLACYDGAIRSAGQARAAIESKDPAAKGQALGRAIGIISELMSSLEHERAPELCDNLERLYLYSLDRMHEAGLSMKVEPIDEVVELLRDLRATWAEAVPASDGAEVGSDV